MVEEGYRTGGLCTFSSVLKAGWASRNIAQDVFVYNNLKVV